MLKKITQPFFTLYVILTFVVSILLAFPLFIILSLGNNSASRRAIHKLIGYWSVWWLWMLGMRVTKLGPPPPEGRYIYIANHISYLDVLVLFPAINGYFRPLGKKEISRIPVVGFIYRQIVIMVDRSSTRSRSRSLRLLWKVLHNEGNIIVFPEGTFNETGGPLKEFYDGAFRLAINTQAPIMPMVFPDTVNRWNYTAWWKFWPGQNRVEYLKPVPTAGLALADLPELKNRIFDDMSAALKKYNYPDTR